MLHRYKTSEENFLEVYPKRRRLIALTIWNAFLLAVGLWKLRLHISDFECGVILPDVVDDLCRLWIGTDAQQVASVGVGAHCRKTWVDLVL